MASKDKTKNLINKATADNRDPPSGYILQELSKRTTSIQECQTIEDLIVKKLQKKQPYVKYKALRVIKYLCENGGSNWRRAWQRNTDKLRDAQQFRGPPDPIYGDAPYQQVRKAAKEAMQSVFQSSQIDNSNIKKRIQSMEGGSNSSYSNEPSRFGSGSTGVFSVHKKSKAPSAPNNKWDNRGNTATKQMQGFGNTNYVPNARKTTFEPLKSAGGYNNPAVLSGSNPHSSGKLDNRGHGHKRKKGNVGGSWGAAPSAHSNNDDGNDEESDDDDDDDNEHDYSADQFPANENSVSSNSKRFGGNIRSTNRGSSKSDGHYEQSWVNDIIRGGGIGAKIPGIDKYVEQFENLSKSHILEFLDDKLEDSDWKKQGKALTLIFALITQGRSGSVVVEYFSQCPDNVQALTKANKSILRRNANAIMNHLDVDEEDCDEDDGGRDGHVSVPIPNKKKNVQSHSQQPSGDLLNLNAEPVAVVQASSNSNDILAFTQDLDGNGDDDDMFGNLNTNESVSNNNNNIANNARNNVNDVVSLIPDDALPTKEELQANANKRKASDYDFLNDLVSNSNVKQDNSISNNNDILQMGFSQNNNNTQSAAVNANSGGGGGSAFGFDLGGDANANNNANNANANVNTNNNNSNNDAFGLVQPSVGGGGGGAGSAFGFDLGGVVGGGNANTNVNVNVNAVRSNNNNNMNRQMGMKQQQAMPVNMNVNPQNTQSQSSSFNFMNASQNNNINSNPMITNNMMQANAQNRQYTQNNMNQLNSMMNQMNMMAQPQQRQMGNTNMNAFQQTMHSVTQPQQQPMMQQTFNHNDPFAQMMSGASSTAKPAQPRQTKPAMDPFSAFSLKAMK